MGVLKKLFSRPQKNSPAPEPPPAPTPAPVSVSPVDAVEKTYRVTGVEHYLDNLMELSSKNDEFFLGKKGLIDEGLIEERVYEYDFYFTRAEIVPEPDNPHDPRAIKVLLDGRHVGYIKAGSCAHLLKVIKAGRVEKIEAKAGGGRYKYITEDYNEHGRATYDMDSDTIPWYVQLVITEKISEKAAK